MKIELATRNKQVAKIAKILETQPVVCVQTDDSKESADLLKALDKENGFSCIKVLHEHRHVHWIINDDWPHLDFNGWNRI